jgi:hypothetical protein
MGMDKRFRAWLNKSFITKVFLAYGALLFVTPIFIFLNHLLGWNLIT